MNHLRYKLSSILIAALFSLSAQAGQGALLGVNIVEPNIFYQSTSSQGGASYDAGSSTLSVSSTPVFLTFNSGGADEFIIGGNLSLTAVIDNSGAFVSGSYTVSGSSTDSSTSTSYSGVLVSGILSDYGIIDTGGVGILDFVGTADSGLLKSLYDAVGSSIGIVFACENCTYADSFAVDWNGTAKGDLGAIPDVPPIEEFPHTIGYWKNHPESWPVSNLTICGANLDQAELLSILKSPVRGDKTISMAHQLIAGLLGGSGGSCPALTADAETWLCDHGGIGAGRKKWDGGEPLKNALDEYNNGNGCSP